MTVAVVNERGGVYYYTKELADALVKLGRVKYLDKAPQTYMTRDMKASASPDEVVVTGEELDANGEPWDENLHVSTKKKNADGTWRKRPGANNQEA